MSTPTKQQEYIERAVKHARKPFVKLLGKPNIKADGRIVYNSKPLTPEETYLGHFGAEDIIFQSRLSYSAFIHYFRYTHAVKLVTRQKQNVLDLGGGVGSIGRMLYQALKKPNYAMIDLDNRTLTKAIKRGYGFCPTLFIQRDLTRKLPFRDESFDFVFAYEILEHMTEKNGRKFIEEIHRVLKHGGRASISTPNNYLGENPSDKAKKFRRYKKHAEITKGGMLDHHPYEWHWEDLFNLLGGTGFEINSFFGLGCPKFKDIEKIGSDHMNTLAHFLPSDIARALCYVRKPQIAENVLFDCTKV